MIVTPGHLEDYDRKSLEVDDLKIIIILQIKIVIQMEISVNSENVYRAKHVKIHPLYVKVIL